MMSQTNSQILPKRCNIYVEREFKRKNADVAEFVDLINQGRRC